MLFTFYSTLETGTAPQEAHHPRSNLANFHGKPPHANLYNIVKGRNLKGDLMQAFILRMKLKNHDYLPEALEENAIFVAKDCSGSLLGGKLSRHAFRKIIYENNYPNDRTWRRAGATAGPLWRFIREMEIGDWVIVPNGTEFYICEVIGPPAFKTGSTGKTYRRPVKWLNNKKPISQHFASPSLVHQIKTAGKIANISESIGIIEDIAKNKKHPKDITATIIEPSTTICFPKYEEYPEIINWGDDNS